MPEKFKDHFSSVSTGYREFRPRYPAGLFDHLAKLIPPGSIVWDCAAGTGQATVDLAKRFRHVIATDASAEQIRSAEPHANIQYRVAAAEKSGLPDNSIDLITVAQALHWFSFTEFFAEVNRVLKPGGFLAAWAYGINQVENAEIDALVQHFYSDIVGPFWPPERKLVEQRYSEIPFPFKEVATPTFVMEENWTLEQLLGYFNTWSAVTRYKKELLSDPVDDLRGKLAPCWGDADRTRKISWPLALKLRGK